MNLFKSLLLICLLGIAFFIALNWQLFEDNLNALFYRRGPVMGERIEGFTEQMSEAAVRERMPGVPLHCFSEPSALPLGDRVCNSYIASYTGIRAMHIAFFWKQGRLAHIKIDIPWWLHNQMASLLVRDFGMPNGAQETPIRGVRLVGWRLQHGFLLYPREPDKNPLWWNTILWVGPTESVQMGGILIPND